MSPRLILPITLIALVSMPCPSLARDVWDISKHGAIEGNDGDSSWRNRHRLARHNTKIIQRGLDTQHEHQLPVYIPGGFWYVQSLTAPYRSGGVLEGAGAHEITSGDWGHPSLGGMATRLIFVDDPGEHDQPRWLLKITGVHFKLVGGFLLSGITEAPEQGEEPCELGLLITKDGRHGLGTGKLMAGHLQFHHFDKAIQNGATAGEANAESNSYEVLGFKDCRIGLELRNSQGMGHWIGSLGAGDASMEAAIDVYGGGMVTIDHGIASCLVLRINGNTPGKLTTGPANGSFVLNNLKVDAGASKPGMFQLVSMTTHAQVDIFSSGGRISGQKFGANGGMFAELRGNASLTVRDWVGNFEQAIHCHDQPAGKGVYRPNVLLDRCRLWGETDNIVVGDAHLALRDCFGWSGTPIANNGAGESSTQETAVDAAADSAP